MTKSRRKWQRIHLSREQGFLTYRDVDKALPKIADQPEELQNVLIFNNLEIKLMDSKDVEKLKKKRLKKKLLSLIRGYARRPRTNVSQAMGKVPLLSREENIFPKELKVLKLPLKIIYSVSLTNDFQFEICKKLWKARKI